MSLASLQEELAELKAARSRALQSQEYGIGSRRNRMADLAEINRAIRDLETRIAIAANGGRINTGHVVFGGHRG